MPHNPYHKLFGRSLTCAIFQQHRLPSFSSRVITYMLEEIQMLSNRGSLPQLLLLYVSTLLYLHLFYWFFRLCLDSQNHSSLMGFTPGLRTNEGTIYDSYIIFGLFWTLSLHAFCYPRQMLQRVYERLISLVYFSESLYGPLLSTGTVFCLVGIRVSKILKFWTVAWSLKM